MDNHRRLLTILGLLVVSALLVGSRCQEQETESVDEPTEPDPKFEWESPKTVATGPADVGPWRMNRSKFHYVDDPAVAFAPNGDIGLTWVDNEKQTLFFQRYRTDVGELTEPVAVSDSPDIFSWLPRIAFGSEGTIYILWQEIKFTGGSHGGEALIARSTNGGESFEAPVNLSNSKAGDGKGRLTKKLWHNGSLAMAVGADNRVYAAWTEYEGRLLFARSTNAGKSFDSPVHVAGDQETPARGPTMVADEDGSIYLAWTSGGAPSADIRFSQSTDEGKSFEPPTGLVTGEQLADGPKLALDDDGGLHLAYGISQGGLKGQYRIEYRRKPDDAESFGEPKRVVRPSPRELHSTRFPHIQTVDDSVFIIWERYEDSNRHPMSLGYSYSLNRGETFASPRLLPGSNAPAGINGSLQGMLMQKLAVSPNGEIAVTNSRFRNEKYSQIQLIRGSLSK